MNPLQLRPSPVIEGIKQLIAGNHQASQDKKICFDRMVERCIHNPQSNNISSTVTNTYPSSIN